MRSKKPNWELELYKIQETNKKTFDDLITRYEELQKEFVKLSTKYDIIKEKESVPTDINTIVAKQVQAVLQQKTVTDLLKKSDDSYEGFELPLDDLSGSIGE